MRGQSSTMILTTTQIVMGEKEHNEPDEEKNILSQSKRGKHRKKKAPLKHAHASFSSVTRPNPIQTR